MKTKAIPLRRNLLPENVFQMIEAYMLGDLSCIHILGVTRDGRIINTSAGDVPDVMRKHDSIKIRS